jgi:type II secretory pathway pseudopilin PulG
MMFVLPLSGSVEAKGVSVIVDPAGARSATRSHAAARHKRAASTPRTTRETGRRKAGIMNTLTILNRMQLRGQHGYRRWGGGSADAGYAMALLLVAMSVMAVMMTVAMPVWKQMAQREKEQELIFRGQQYARAVGLFQRKYANTPPPSLDVLVQEHFLRKKYKDPITNADFVPIPVGQAGTATPGATGQRGAPAGRGGPGAGQPATGGPAVTAARGGIIGVTSASTAASIRIYNGATRYNQWRFVYAPAAATPGAGTPGSAVPGTPVPGQRGGGQRGQPPSPPNLPGFGPTFGGGPPGRGGPNAPVAPNRGR